jgi:glycosyltransferase involved in cell wall biosynthesis
LNIKNNHIIFSANTAWYLYNFRRSSISLALKMGYSVSCVAGKDDYSNKLKDLGASFYPLNINKSSINPISEIKLLLDIFRIYRMISPAVIFQFTVKNNLYGSIISKVLKINCVNNISGLGTGIIEDGLTSKLIKILYKVTQNFPFHTHFQNTDDLKYMKKLKLIGSNVSVIPGSGVDTAYFNPKVVSANNNKVFTFLYVGRLLKDKGLIELFSAMRSLTQGKINVQLHVVGIRDLHNPSAIDSKSLAEWGEKKYITFFHQTDDVRQYLSSADCFVLPSYREGLSRSILEAMAMSLPVITTNVPGCSHLVEDGVNGFLCESKSIHSLARAMDRMTKLDLNKRIELGKNGRKMAIKKFDIKLVEKSVSDCIIAIQEYDK